MTDALTDALYDAIERGMERIPVLEAEHTERHQGRAYVVTQRVSRNVLTDFDRKLSRHLAATRGAGLPAFTTVLEVREASRAGASRRFGSAHHKSLPHALCDIAERAFSRCGSVPIAFRRGTVSGEVREIGGDEVEILEVALRTCAYLGEAEFLDISGDLDIVIATPPAGLRPVVMQLRSGLVSIPSGDGSDRAPVDAPIFGFAGHVAESATAQGYLARARHALVAEKEAAISAFRAAAERRILDFDRALAGRQLEAHRRAAAEGLVARLRAGLGEDLNGLSEDARIIALDWCDGIDRRQPAETIREAV